MRIDYDRVTDSLHIMLADHPSEESEEIYPGFILDFDAAGRVIGIGIEHASESVDLSRLESVKLPA